MTYEQTLKQQLTSYIKFYANELNALQFFISQVCKVACVKGSLLCILTMFGSTKGVKMNYDIYSLSHTAKFTPFSIFIYFVILDGKSFYC